MLQNEGMHEPVANSCRPALIVALDNPVASATRAIPPRPSALASTAAQRRRVLSLSNDSIAANFS